MEGSSSKSLAPYYWLDDFTALERLLSVHTGALFIFGWMGNPVPIPSPTHGVGNFLLPKTRNEAIARTTAQGDVVGLIGIR